jgi:hypothetical protein
MRSGAAVQAIFWISDGYPWEVAFNPFIPLGADGRLILPD